MIKKLDLSNEETAKDILELQTASYKIEAELIGFSEIPPLKDTLDSLKKCQETFYGYYKDDALAGIISYKITDNILDIYRVAVHPSFFRMGIADALINFVENLHKYIGKAAVSTGKENLPAVSLYLKEGYKKVRDVKVSEGIYITEFEKTW